MLLYFYTALMFLYEKPKLLSPYKVYFVISELIIFLCCGTRNDILSVVTLSSINFDFSGFAKEDVILNGRDFRIEDRIYSVITNRQWK